MQSQNEQQLLNERRRKQMYLKEEILDKGFDPNRFSEFLCNIKPEGNNIDVWDYEELLNAVTSFKRVEQSMQDQFLDETTMSLLQNMENDQSRFSTTSRKDLDTSSLSKISEQIKPQPKSSVPQSQNNLSRTTTLNTTVVNTSTVSQSTVNRTASLSGVFQGTANSSFPNINPQTNNPLREDMQNKHHPSAKDQTLMGIDMSQYVEITQTKKAETTPLFQKEAVSITVSDPEQIKGGVFSSNFIQYTIKTKPFEWSVKRRYNDFYWLRETLQRLHPGVFIPPIPSKKNKNKFLDETVKKRMYFFEIFLNACLEHADLKTDKYFYEFLYTLEDKHWTKIKEEADKIMRPRKMDELNTALGQAKLDVNPDLTKYIALVEHYSNETTPIYKKIRKISKEMITHLKAIANMPIELSQCFTNLQLHTTSFNKNVSPAYSLRMGSLYPNLTKMMVSWSEQIQKQANAMYKNFFCFYKYAAYENEVYAEMSNFKAELEAEYMKQSKDLIAKKQRLFEIGDMRQWDVDIPKAKLIPKEEIFKNKTLAYPVMLKDESKEVKIQRDMVAYLNQSVAAEMARGLEQRCLLYNTNFREFLDKQSDSMEKLTTGWEDIYEGSAEPRSRSIVQANQLNQSIKEALKSSESDKKKKKK